MYIYKKSMTMILWIYLYNFLPPLFWCNIFYSTRKIYQFQWKLHTKCNYFCLTFQHYCFARISKTQNFLNVSNTIKKNINTYYTIHVRSLYRQYLKTTRSQKKKSRTKKVTLSHTTWETGSRSTSNKSHFLQRVCESPTHKLAHNSQCYL